MKSGATIIAKFKKALYAVSFYLCLAFLLLLFVMQLKPVQTYLAQLVLSQLSQKTDHQIGMKGTRISWLDEASFYDFILYDQKGDTLLYFDEVTINYSILNLFKGNYLNIQDIDAGNIRLNLQKDSTQHPLNISAFLEGIKSEPDSTKQATALKVEEISFKQMDLSITDHSKEQLTNRLDPAHLDLKIQDFELDLLTIQNDTIRGALIDLELEEKNSDFNVTDLKTDFSLSQYALSLDNIFINTPHSHITDSIEFFYSDIKDLGDFVNKVSFVFFMNETRISHLDILTLTGIDIIKSDIQLDGLIWGTVGDFNIEEARIGFGEESFIEGGVSCFGLPDPDKTFLLADLTNAKLSPKDVYPYTEKYKSNLSLLGDVDFTGSLAGFLKDFVARGDFSTSHGTIHTDIKLTIPKDITELSYSGNVALRKLRVSDFIQNDYVNVINLNASVKGSGLTKEKANFELDASIINSNIKGYEYDTIKTKGTFKSQYFNGIYAVIDPECDLKGTAEIDFTQEDEILQVDVQVNNLDFESLNFTETYLSTKGHLNLDMIDLDLDAFQGTLSLDSIELTRDSSTLLLETVRFYSYDEGEIRNFQFEIPGVKGVLKGDFKLSEVLEDLPGIIQGYASKLNLVDDSLQLPTNSFEYSLRAVVEVEDFSPYLRFLQVPIEVSSNSLFEASIRKSNSSNISIFYESDYISYDSIKIKKPTVEANASKSGSGNILTNFIVNSSTINMPGIPPISDVLLEGIWENNKIDITSSLLQKTTDTNLDIEGIVSLYKDSTEFHFLPSDITLFDEEFIFNTSNSILIEEGRIKVDDLTLSSLKSSLSVEGTQSGPNTSFAVDIDNFELRDISSLLNQDISGKYSTNFTYLKEDELAPLKLQGDFTIIDLMYDDLLVGDVSGDSRWDSGNNGLRLLMNIEREGFKEIDLIGSYYPLGTDNQLDLRLSFHQANLSLLAPFVEENFANLKGNLDGKVYIGGNLKKPVVEGGFDVFDGGGTINYLNTNYSFEGGVSFEQDLLRINDFHIRDRKGADATLRGTVSFKTLDELSLDLGLEANDFEFLNTTSLDNDLFYGAAYGSGQIYILGSLDDLTVKANVQTGNGTNFFIPLEEQAETEGEYYITFSDFLNADSLSQKDSEKILGLTLDFDLQINENAYCELIFDAKSGDIIRGRGNGNLKLTLDTDGEFSMFGGLEIVEGGYNFAPSLGGATIISKEFTVEKGSTITWYGDPYNAAIDMTAAYLQRASFEELKAEGDRDESLLNVKEPVVVVLDLDGDMLKPNIGFDIRVDEDQASSNTYDAELTQIRSDEQELSRQVISLLFLKRFSPKESFFTATGGGSIGSSVSQYLSNQVSYLVSQIDENLELEVNLADLDKEAFNNLQLRFAYTFLGGRMKVSRGGTFNQQDDEESNFLNDIVGDWSVEYSLTRDGKLRAKVFRNTNNENTTVYAQQGQEVGFSVRLVYDFNDFKDLLNKTREEGMKQKQADEGL